MTNNKSALEALNRSYNFFWTGFILYTLSASFPNLSQMSYYFTQSVQLIGIMIFVPASIRLVSWKFDNNYLLFVFYFYSLWSVSIVLRGFQFNYVFLKQLLLDNNYGIFIYLAPFIILFPRNISFLKKAFLVIFILSLFYILYHLVIFPDTIMGFTRN